MHIPRAWAKVSAECRTQDNRELRVAVWGWGPEEATAKREAASRLERLIERIRRGDPFPDVYAYGNRPLREEILQTFDGEAEDQPKAVLTRNRYGARVLNTARLLFLDIDLAPPSFGQRLRRLFSSSRSRDDEAELAKLRDALRQFGRATFRLYRTAAGLRAIAIDREFDPVGRDAQELMNATGTDPAFVRLCVAQKSFRARLTPKPWRCKCSLPPGQHPRIDDTVRHRFATWLGEYELASSKYATCRYIETIGSADLKGTTEKLVTLHDRVTRCGESLPLA
jgi:hypothetical protein